MVGMGYTFEEFTIGRLSNVFHCDCYFTALATRKWLYPVLAIWPVFSCHIVMT